MRLRPGWLDPARWLRLFRGPIANEPDVEYPRSEKRRRAPGAEEVPSAVKVWRGSYVSLHHFVGKIRV